VSAIKAGWVLALSGAVGLAVAGESATTPSSPGYVEGSRFLDLASPDDSTVEVALQGALLKALVGFDPELAEQVGGLESIHAVVLELAGTERLRQARDTMRKTESDLLERGWQRLARVKDGTANVGVFVLSDAEVVKGLVVLVLDEEEGALVFANVAGIVDLAALAALGQELEIPGLDQLPAEPPTGEDP
jgi:hypothetical protein